MIVGTNYGKFASTQYPYLLWEPSDEGTIRLAAQAYLNKAPTSMPVPSATRAVSD
jgi:hypothetical protein